MPFPADDPRSLEFSPDEMRALLDTVSARVLDHLARVGEQHATGRVVTDMAALRTSMRESTPEEPAPIEPILDDWFDEWASSALTTNGTGYMGYIPGGGIFPAALADLL